MSSRGYGSRHRGRNTRSGSKIDILMFVLVGFGILFLLLIAVLATSLLFKKNMEALPTTPNIEEPMTQAVSLPTPLVTDPLLQPLPVATFAASRAVPSSVAHLVEQCVLPCETPDNVMGFAPEEKIILAPWDKCTDVVLKSGVRFRRNLREQWQVAEPHQMVQDVCRPFGLFLLPAQ